VTTHGRGKIYECLITHDSEMIACECVIHLIECFVSDSMITRLKIEKTKNLLTTIKKKDS